MSVEKPASPKGSKNSFMAVIAVLTGFIRLVIFLTGKNLVLTIHYWFDTDIDDGKTILPAGEYRQIIVVPVAG